jgi:hypothetical protein
MASKILTGGMVWAPVWLRRALQHPGPICFCIHVADWTIHDPYGCLAIKFKSPRAKWPHPPSGPSLGAVRSNVYQIGVVTNLYMAYMISGIVLSMFQEFKSHRKTPPTLGLFRRGQSSPLCCCCYYYYCYYDDYRGIPLLPMHLYNSYHCYVEFSTGTRTSASTIGTSSICTGTVLLLPLGHYHCC